MADEGADQPAGQPVGQPAGKGLPWAGKPRPADTRCWSALSLTGLYYLVLLPFKPALIGTAPLLLTLLTGSTTGIVTSAAFARTGEFPLAVVVAVALPGLMKFDLIYWWAGKLWGPRILSMFGGRFRHRRFGERAGRLSTRYAWFGVITAYYLPVPGVLLLANAGWSGMSWRRFLVFDLIGTLLWIIPLTALGYAIGQPAVDVAKTVSRYALWISIGLIGVIIGVQIWRARRGQEAPSG